MALDDKAQVGHKHTTSDVRGGRFPTGMLPSGLVLSIETAQGVAESALSTAASKNRAIFSDLEASGTAYSNGDIWYQRIAGIIIAQWEFTGGAWASRTLDGAVVANLDASRITTGTLAAGTTITAGDPEGSRIELDSAGLRKYAPDGTTVQVDLTGEYAAFSGLITGSEIIAGTAGAARIELDATGLRQYAADGTTVLLDTADDATIRARGDSAAFGWEAQKALTTGVQNTAVGTRAQYKLTTGSVNTAIGSNAQYDLTTGGWNTAIGPAAQQKMTTGADNTAVGIAAQAAGGKQTTTANYQTSVGGWAGQSSATQVDGITTIGYEATAGAANATSIGREARADHAGSIALGYQALTTQTDQVMVGPRDVEITDTTKGIVLVSPDATRMRITAADDGSLLVNGAPGGCPPASATAAGISEFATSAETITGTDDTRATTPAGVKAAIDAVVVPGAWTAYTPTVGGITIGNGVVTGRWVQIGKTVHVKVKLVLGSTTAMTGLARFSVPVAVLAGTSPVPARAGLVDAGSNNYNAMACLVTYLDVGFISATGGMANFTATVPFTWAATDEVHAAVTYETA